jgi:hypothetical protein
MTNEEFKSRTASEDFSVATEISLDIEDLVAKHFSFGSDTLDIL